MPMPTNTLTVIFTGEVSMLQDGAVGRAHVIHASTHVRLACGGAIKLLPYALTWSLTQVGGNLSPRGAGATCLENLTKEAAR